MPFSNKSYLVILFCLASNPVLADYNATVVGARASSQNLVKLNFKQTLAKANCGDPVSQMNLGVCFLTGFNVERNYNTAYYWFNKAASQNFPQALYNMGVLYYKGYGVPIDYKKARYWFKRGAIKGNKESMYYLGIIYGLGKGVAKNQKIADYWLDKVIKLGDSRMQKDALNVKAIVDKTKK